MTDELDKYIAGLVADQTKVTRKRYVPAEDYDALQAKLSAVLAALKMAVTQNDCDMLMTGEELRKCYAAIALAESTTPPTGAAHD